jgi:hypothetical protein
VKNLNLYHTRRPKIYIIHTQADLEKMAAELNPLVKYWDPLNLVDVGLYGKTGEASIQFLRESEIKHGRVAMAAFVGYIVQSNFVFPWPLTTSGTAHPGTDLSPPEQFDALPLASKLQIIGFVGFLEWFWAFNKTDKVGAYPSLKGALPHPVPFDLFDPFQFSKNRSADAKARGLLAEINNGRLAMIGIFGFLSAQTIPGSVPMLTNIVKPYSGNIWAPFEADFPL